jgi:hypothetical protein
MCSIPTEAAVPLTSLPDGLWRWESDSNGAALFCTLTTAALSAQGVYPEGPRGATWTSL